MPARTRVREPGFDVVVIGAGAVGLAVAMTLSKAGRSVLILERESAIGRGITSRNSEIVHAGLYYPTDSLKAELCVRGRELLYAWCSEKRVDVRRLGKLIVATRVSEEAVLDDLLARGLSNGVVGLERIGESEIARLEPEMTAVHALYSPETGIVDGQAFCLSMLAAAESKGAVISLGRSVLALESRSYGWRVEVGAPGESSEYIDAGIVVDAGGLDADRIAELAGLDVDALRWRQYPCKGDYFSLAPSVGLRLQRLIYPVPQQAGLGIHATLDLAGRIRFGPDIEYVGEVDVDAFRVDPRKAQDFAEAVNRYLPNVRATDLTPDYAGIRPKLAGPGEPFRDFVIEEATAQGAPGFVATIGIESPGLTASLAIADRVASLI